MPWPPTIPSGTRTNATAMDDLQAADHNEIHAALDDIVIHLDAAGTINVKQYGTVGTADDTAVFEAADTAAAAAGVGLYVPAGTYVLDGWTPTAKSIFGAGMGVTILQRKASSAVTNTVAFASRNGFTISDLTIDGNKANQTNAGNNLVLTSCYNFRVERVEAKNAKASAGNGSGIIAAGTADEANGTISIISGCISRSNDGFGIAATGAASNLTIQDSAAYSNGSSGITLYNLTFAPSPDTIKRCRIHGNRVYSNTGTGISVPGFITGGSLVAPVYGHGSDPATDITISENYVYSNTAYGIVAQFTRGKVVDNTCNSNGGTAAFYAGILANANGVTISRNRCYRNEYYGIDAGASQYCDVVDNDCEENGFPSTSDSGNGINVGASVGTTVRSNRCKNNGNTMGIQITCPRVDGAGGGSIAFPWDTTDIRIIDNTVIGSAGNHVGIKVLQDPLDIEVRGNRAYGCTANNAIIIESTQAVVEDNWSDSAMPTYSMASAATVVFPDYVRDIIVNAASSLTVSGVRPYTVNAFINAIFAVKMTARGSGYTSAPTVVFTGGAGTGAAATAFITHDGLLANVRIDNPGSGYTSAPTMSFTGGGGTGATATATIAPWTALDGRAFNLLISGAFTTTFSSGSRTVLAGSVSYAAGDKDSITFRGYAGALYEQSRTVT